MSKHIRQVYNLTYNKLIENCREKTVAAERDIAELTTRGYTQARLDAFKAAWEGLEETEPDYDTQGDVSIAIDARDETMDAGRTAVGEISTRAALLWGYQSPKYRRYKVATLSRMNGYDLCHCLARTARIGQQQLAELAAVGLTQPMLDALPPLLATLQQHIATVEDAEYTREETTVTRTGQSNNVYKLLTELCETAKLYWETRSFVHYKQYVIYHKPKKKKKAAAPEEGVAGAI